MYYVKLWGFSQTQLDHSLRTNTSMYTVICFSYTFLTRFLTSKLSWRREPPNPLPHVPPPARGLPDWYRKMLKYIWIWVCFLGNIDCELVSFSQYTCTVLNLLFHWSPLICTSIVFRDRGIVMGQSLLFSQLIKTIFQIGAGSPLSRAI